MDKLGKLGIFGGSFDPIHNAHIEFALQAQLFCKLNRVDFVVANLSPFKINETQMDSRFRFDLVQQAISNYDDFVAQDYEIHKPGISYTYETIEYYRSQFPNTDLYLLLGEDSFLEISTWKHSEIILSNTKIIVCKRLSIGNSREKLISTLDNIKQITEVIVLPEPVSDLSSSHIRDLFKHNANLDGIENQLNDLVPAVVKTSLLDFYSSQIRA